MLTSSVGRFHHSGRKRYHLVSRIIHRSQSTTTTTAPLYSEIVDNKSDGMSTVFLHGLLGNGRNLKTFAKQVCTATDATGYLMDLRGHGRSRLTAASSGLSSTGTHSFDACVKDVAESTKDLSMTSIVGHSWGGRIALQYAATQRSDSLQRVWLLDTVPGQGRKCIIDYYYK
jgi:pimeloyl-ACP methyl ester carboxylesterase